MVLCSSLNNTKFQKGGIYETLDNDPDYPDVNYTLCPETGDIDYNGFTGTNLWVIPKGNLTNDTVAQEYAGLIGIDFRLISSTFSI